MRYFLLILLSIILSKNSFSQESYAEEKIHWKIILPEDFQKTIIELNKDKELIKSIKVTEQYFKVDYSDYVDTSRVVFDTNGRISKIDFDYNRLIFYRHYVNKNGQDYHYLNLGNRVFSYTLKYNEADLLSSLKVYYYDTELGENVFDYEYILMYNNDSNIREVIVKDSISEIGKIELIYKNNKVIKENCFWDNKLTYKIQYHYIVDKRKNNEVIKVTKTINGITSLERLYNSGEEILEIKIDGSFMEEFYKIPLYSKGDYKSTEYNYLYLQRKKRIISGLYPNPETSLFCNVGRFDNTDNFLSSHELYLSAFPEFASGVKWIYSKDGLLKKYVYDKENGGSEEIIQEYFYKYSDNKPNDKVSFSLVFILKDTISTDTLITTIYTDKSQRNYFPLNDLQVKSIDSLYLLDAKYKIKSFEVGITYGGGMKISNSKNNIIDDNKKQLLKVAGKGVILVYISDLIIVGKNNERIEINSLMLK